MDLKEEDEDQKQLFLVDGVSPRDPLVSAGAIVATASGQEDLNPGDLQTSVLAGLMSAQSSSVCFPAKFSKCCPVKSLSLIQLRGSLGVSSFLSSLG